MTYLNIIFWSVSKHHNGSLEAGVGWVGQDDIWSEEDDLSSGGGDEVEA